MTAKTDTVLALQVMVKLFDYFPTTRAAIIGGMALGKVPPVQLEEASRLAADWKQNYGYQFDVRDFYLINMLARDPMRRNLRRTQLVMRTGAELHQAASRAPRSPGRDLAGPVTATATSSASTSTP